MGKGEDPVDIYVEGNVSVYRSLVLVCLTFTHQQALVKQKNVAQSSVIVEGGEDPVDVNIEC